MMIDPITATVFRTREAAPCLRERRERIATAVLAGLLSNTTRSTVCSTAVAAASIKFADALIAELDKQP